jgi:hypothetical protein
MLLLYFNADRKLELGRLAEYHLIFFFITVPKTHLQKVLGLRSLFSLNLSNENKRAGEWIGLYEMASALLSFG